MSEMFNYTEHYLGISFITLAFIIMLFNTLKLRKTLAPKSFYLLYGIGGLLIMKEMINQQKPFVYYQELLGALIALFLFIY